MKESENLAKLLTIAEAAEATGLSDYELRLGQKAGRYPALEIGNTSGRARRLRWNLEVLMAAIQAQMTVREEENA